MSLLDTMKLVKQPRSLLSPALCVCRDVGMSCSDISQASAPTLGLGFSGSLRTLSHYLASNPGTSQVPFNRLFP